MAVYSPRVDGHGNSVRGIGVCRELSRGLALHLVRPGERHAPVIRASSTIAERPSKRVRLRGQRLALDQHAARTAVFELQGELGFAAVEAVSRKLTTDGDRAELVVVDLRRILRADPSGFGLLASLGRQLERRGGRLAVAGAPELSSAPEEGIACSFDDLDRALEWCEEELLGELGQGAEGDGISIEHHELLSGLTGDEVAELDRELGFVSAAPHDLLAQAGEPAHELLLVTRGTLSVYSAAEGSERRLTTLSAGMTFGELPFVDRGARTADVRADSQVECRILSYDAIDRLELTNPALYGKLLRNVLGIVIARLHAANLEADRLSA